MTLLKYEHIPIDESGDPLVDLSDYNFILEPFYYRNNLSSDPKIYTRRSIADKLLEAQQGLAGRTFKIWDGWRSREVQQNIYRQYWKQMEAENPGWDEEQLRVQVGTFVSVGDNPDRIPIHATGGAIDLTLVEVSGEEVDMGTVFDHFGPEAAAMYYEENNIDEVVRDNRRLLRGAMGELGFRFDEDEWWHFDYGNQLWAAALGHKSAIYGECTPE